MFHDQIPLIAQPAFLSPLMIVRYSPEQPVYFMFALFEKGLGLLGLGGHPVSSDKEKAVGLLRTRRNLGVLLCEDLGKHYS
jgi:hypothetical protein